MMFANNLLSLILTLAATSAWASPIIGMRQDQTLYKLQISRYVTAVPQYVSISKLQLLVPRARN